MGYVDELRFMWNLLWNPGKYAKRQLDFGGAVKLYYMLAVLPFIAYVVLGSLAVAFGYPSHQYGGNTLFSFLYMASSSLSYISVLWGGILLFFVVLPLGIAIDALIYQLIAKVFLNSWKGNYDRTFTALVYGLFPLLLLLWLSVLPLFNSLFVIIAPIWSIVLIVIGLSMQQKVTRLNAMLLMAAKSFFVLLFFVLLGVSVFSTLGFFLSHIIPVTSIGPLSNLTSGWIGTHGGVMIPWNTTP